MVPFCKVLKRAGPFGQPLGNVVFGVRHRYVDPAVRNKDDFAAQCDMQELLQPGAIIRQCVAKINQAGTCGEVQCEGRTEAGHMQGNTVTGGAFPMPCPSSSPMGLACASAAPVSPREFSEANLCARQRKRIAVDGTAEDHIGAHLLHDRGEARNDAQRNASADSFTERRQVRRDAEAPLLAACVYAEPGGHLVEDEKRAVLVRQLANTVEIPGTRHQGAAVVKDGLHHEALVDFIDLHRPDLRGDADATLRVQFLNRPRIASAHRPKSSYHPPANPGLTSIPADLPKVH